VFNIFFPKTIKYF